MRSLGPFVAGIATLLLLWPASCFDPDDGPTTCDNVVWLPLLWQDDADTWGVLTATLGALVVAAATCLVLRGRRRRRVGSG